MTDNEIIAKYMGDVTTDLMEWKETDKRLVSEYLYDKSWDWLIPVIEKLEDEVLLGDDVDPNDWRDRCGIITFSKLVGVHIRGFFLHKEETLLKSAYAAVVEAIIFLTEEKQK